MLTERADHKVTFCKPTKKLKTTTKKTFTSYLDNTVKYVSIVIAISAVHTEVFHGFRAPKIT